MALRKEDALSVELVDVGTQKNGRYRKRQNMYTFKCICCPATMIVTSYDLKKVSGNCRECANLVGAAKTCLKNRKRPYEALFNKFDYDRKRFNQESSLTYEEFVEFTKSPFCAYCKDPVSWAEFCISTHGHKYNLDRMDNSRGYHKDNLAVCCWICNQIKSSRLTHQEMLVAMEAVVNLRNG